MTTYQTDGGWLPGAPLAASELAGQGRVSAVPGAIRSAGAVFRARPATASAPELSAPGTCGHRPRQCGLDGTALPTATSAAFEHVLDVELMVPFAGPNSGAGARPRGAPV